MTTRQRLRDPRFRQALPDSALPKDLLAQRRAAQRMKAVDAQFSTPEAGAQARRATNAQIGMLYDPQFRQIDRDTAQTERVTRSMQDATRAAYDSLGQSYAAAQGGSAAGAELTRQLGLSSRQSGAESVGALGREGAATITQLAQRRADLQRERGMRRSSMLDEALQADREAQQVAAALGVESLSDQADRESRERIARTQADARTGAAETAAGARRYAADKGAEGRARRESAPKKSKEPAASATFWNRTVPAASAAFQQLLRQNGGDEAKVRRTMTSPMLEDGTPNPNFVPPEVYAVVYDLARPSRSGRPAGYLHPNNVQGLHRIGIQIRGRYPTWRAPRPSRGRPPGGT